MKRFRKDTRFLFFASMLSLTSVVLSGCRRSDGIERVRLSGTVTYQGQPVIDGQLRFVPTQGTSVPLAVATIAEGRYDLTGSGGIPVGRFRVEIRAFDPKTPAPKFPGDPQRTQLLPNKFNTQSTLELTVESGQTDLKQDFTL